MKYAEIADNLERDFLDVEGMGKASTCGLCEVCNTATKYYEKKSYNRFCSEECRERYSAFEKYKIKAWNSAIDEVLEYLKQSKDLIKNAPNYEISSWLQAQHRALRDAETDINELRKDVY